MMMTSEFFESFNNAVARADNRNEDGSINWDFVDADLWMENVINEENKDIAYVWFNDLADAVEGV